MQQLKLILKLLGALTIVNTEKGYELAYYKNAISVIENVVYAHDSERKWIQSHPIVIYETYILQHIMNHLCKQVNALGKNLFAWNLYWLKVRNLRKMLK